MVFPDPYPSPPEPDAFSPMPYAATEEDSTAQWAQVAGYVQPEPIDGIHFDFESLDAIFPWEQGSTLSEPTPDSQLGGDLGFDWTTMVAGDITGYSPSLEDLAATASVPAPPLLTTNIDYTNDFLFDIPEWDFTQSLTPGLTDVSSVTSPQTDSIGDQLPPFPTYETAAASQFIPTSATPIPTFDFTGVFQPEQVACTPPSWLTGDGIDFSGQTQPGYASNPNLMNMYGNTHMETNFDMAAPIDVSSVTATTSTEGVGVSGTVLGKRSRTSSYELPQKRGKPNTDGVLDAAGSTKRTRRTPAIRTQHRNNGKSEAVGHGAGRLVSTTAQGVYHRFLLGPSVPQESVGALAQGKPSWTEEREQEETRHDMGSNLPQQIEPQKSEIAEDMEGLHAIPKTLRAWQRLLLQTTQADVERGAVSVIKCRLCPTEGFKTWACFFRHCRDCEEHPARIRSCERCGIYFGRQDSKKRHTDSATKACCETTPAEATWRKHRAEQLLAAFQTRVEHCLMTGEELGPKFSAIARAELPSRSKKVFISKLEGNDSQVARL